jgi:hypothetical protein
MQGIAQQEATLKSRYSLSQRLMCRQVLSQFAGFTGTKVQNTDAAAAAAESSEESAKKGLGVRF